MNRIQSLLIAVAAVFAASCNTAVQNTTEVSGELLADSKIDTIKVVYLEGSTPDTTFTFPVTNDQFSFSVPTDKMKLALAMVRNNDGVVSGYFIPEGQPMKIQMTKQGRLKVITEGKGSLTEQYNQVSQDIRDYQKKLNIEVDSLVRANHFNQAQADSLVKAYSIDLTKFIEDNCRETALENKDNAVGLMALMTLSKIISKEELAVVVGKMSEEIQGQKDIVKALE